MRPRAGFGVVAGDGDPPPGVECPREGRRPRRPQVSATRLALALSVPFLATAIALAQAPDWLLRDAEIRFEVEIVNGPSAPCAGVIALLPDGGLLPGSAPNPTVFDAAGKELASECLWHNPREGLALVFSPPADGRRAFIYLRSAPQLRVATPQSPFCPSLVLYTAPGNSLEDARRLGNERLPGRRGRMGQVPYIALRENPYGPDDNFVTYHTGYLKIEKPGRYYFATISDEGSECRVAGKLAASWPGIHTRADGETGQKGNWVELPAGQHRLEYWHFEVTGPQQCQLAWRTPDDKPNALPQNVPQSAFIHSGSTRIVGVQRRDGTPVAVFRPEADRYLWLADQPVALYQLQAATIGETARGAEYTWDFGDGLRLQTNACVWPVEGLAPRDVRLTVSVMGRQYQCERPMYFDHAPTAASINQAYDRAAYRNALLMRCLAVATGRRPAADWSPNLWTILLAVVRPYEDGALPLLGQLFERSRQDLRALKTADRWYLEDVFLDLLQRDASTPADQEQVRRWLAQLLSDETDRFRRFHWQMAEVEFQLYRLKDPAAARKTVESLYQGAVAVGPAASVRLQVRYGDLAQLQGRYAEAQKIYTEAQDQYRRQSPDWRTEAVREASYYEMVRSLLDQEDLYGARDILTTWELEFPLSKLGGDYPLAEGRYWMAADDYERAATILKAYRQGTDLSPFVAQAMELEMECLLKLRSAEEMKALAEDIQRRFPKLPLAGLAAEAV
ncbi:hypothetical protein HQ590_05360, partial [bacterium]|nr:hypothetical protein [bacterium]